VTTTSFDRRVEIETPEQTILSYTVAGVGTRVAAALADHLLIVAGMLGIFLVMSEIGSAARGRGSSSLSSSAGWAVALSVLIVFAFVWGYYVMFEAIWDGQTPGKRWLGLRVVQDGGYSVSFGASAARNLLRVVDFFPGFYGVGLASVVISKSGKRVGDMVAGTFVVHEKLATIVATAIRAPEGVAAAAITSRLTEEEFALLGRFMSRRTQLDPERRTAFAAQIATRFRAHLTDNGSAPSARLLRLYESESEARARGLPSRGAMGAARERHAIVARNAGRWRDFATALTVAQRSGLRAMSPEQVSQLVSLYREGAADLARLRTASDSEDQDAIFYVSRLVGAGHNFLYRQRAVAMRDVWRFVTVAVPREVRRSTPFILAGALFLFGPMAITYVALVRHPELASRLLPAGMIDRVVDGAHRDSVGKQEYIAIKDFERPVVASTIISNNIQVTYGVFAYGITAGVMTLYMLVANGMGIGAAFGLYRNHGILHQIGGFAVAHSVLELSAICIAAGGGFLLAAALLVPGALTRREALVVNGRRALRLIAATTLMLMAAGTIEGLISPRTDVPTSIKIGIAAATAVLLAFWFSRGRGDEPEAPVEMFAYSEPRALSSR
jgi:uncharacterized RDD family membrane protein YckC/uncharacterized membrane protein SpoIIM required for sporulation